MIEKDVRYIMSKFHLINISDFLKDYIKVLSSNIGLDFYIVDHNLIRIACTGKTEVVVGIPLSKNSITYKVFTTGEQIYMNNPRKSSLCKWCEINESGNCMEEHAMYYPIFIENEITGVIVIYGTTPLQKSILKDKQKELNLLSKNMTSIIEIKLKDKRNAGRYMSILKNVDEGIIITDFEGNIIYSNEKSNVSIKKHSNIRDIFNTRNLSTLEDADNNEKVKLNIENYNGNVYVSRSYINIEDRFSEIMYMIYFNNYSNSGIKFKKSNNKFNEIVGSSIETIKLRDLVEKASKYDFNVLILGESGTGKGLIAKSIHDNSHRKNKPFISINCSAIPENLIESELFGYESGAFSGASKNGKAGSFELANGGTIFLDEIGDMGLSLQPKLLKVLDNKEIKRLGGIRSINLDIRVIAATNRNLKEMVSKKQFRKDLYFRLSVMNIDTVPLRKRVEDILMLSNHFLEKYNRKYNKKIKSISDKAMKSILIYEWAGNVRELDNAIEYSVAMENKDKLSFESLPNSIKENKNNISSQKLSDLRKDALSELLIKYGNTPYGKQKVAQELGISMSTLYRDIKKYKLNEL